MLRCTALLNTGASSEQVPVQARLNRYWKLSGESRRSGGVKFWYLIRYSEHIWYWGTSATTVRTPRSSKPARPALRGMRSSTTRSSPTSSSATSSWCTTGSDGAPRSRDPPSKRTEMLNWRRGCRNKEKPETLTSCRDTETTWSALQSISMSLPAGLRDKPKGKSWKSKHTPIVSEWPHARTRQPEQQPEPPASRCLPRAK